MKLPYFCASSVGSCICFSELMLPFINSQITAAILPHPPIPTVST